jgi:hypothetical protein
MLEINDIAGEVLDAEELAGLETAETPFDLALPESVEERRLLDALYDDLERGEHAKAVLAEAEMRRVIEFNRAVENRPMDGLGQVMARVPLEVFLHWAAREGPEFWQQESNLRYFDRRNPGFRPEMTMKPTVIVEHKLPGNGTMMKESAGVETGSYGVAARPPRPTRAVKGRRGRWAA